MKKTKKTVAPAAQAAPAAAPRRETPKRRLKIKYVRTSKLKLWKKNPRRNDAAAERLCGLLEEHGFINPIIATRDNVVRAGNTRLKSARMGGLDEVPVIYVDFESEAEAEMFSVADNRSAQFAEWDEDMLADVLSERKALPVERMAAMSGFSQPEIEGLREGSLPQGNDPAAEWQGMPEYQHEHLESFRHIVVHFKSNEDAKVFGREIGQTVTKNTRSLWFPPDEIGTIADKRYGEDGKPYDKNK